ncbi:hypothetical protein TSOC_009208 [Tetrabaena socialis]|uniref:Uncharacterized protein n=1 Tax=Tetrabaena socialis TaxID=47790 RepID=A0A2J7ZWH4_9CHLO|nr:hypothetical protein TSOC_009208 [Tetrabaena socialis]|eukprot:PNH04608.1 hypothetical protein TSOC_009208 [Tetrabaena socialis]
MLRPRLLPLLPPLVLVMTMQLPQQWPQRGQEPQQQRRQRQEQQRQQQEQRRQGADGQQRQQQQGRRPPSAAAVLLALAFAALQVALLPSPCAAAVQWPWERRSGGAAAAPAATHPSPPPPGAVTFSAASGGDGSAQVSYNSAVDPAAAAAAGSDTPPPDSQLFLRDLLAARDRLPYDPTLPYKLPATSYDDSEFVFATGSFPDRYLLAQATRSWRRGGIRAFFAVNNTEDLPLLNENNKAHGERYEYFPDEGAGDLGDRNHGYMKGDTRAAMAPFMAHEYFGETYKWMLYGDDDTIFYMPAIKRLLAHLDPEMPLVLSDNLWYRSKHPNFFAPRCLPCHMAVDAHPVAPGGEGAEGAPLQGGRRLEAGVVAPVGGGEVVLPHTEPGVAVNSSSAALSIEGPGTEAEAGSHVGLQDGRDRVRGFFDGRRLN